MAPKRSNEQKAECEQSKKTKFDSNVSGEGNPSSSTPTEGSDMMNVSGNQTESSTDEDYVVEESETEESGYQTESATETESSDMMIVCGDDSKSGYQTETATETESFDMMIVCGDDSKSGNQIEGSNKMSASGEESKPMEDPKSGRNSPPGQILPEQLLISLIGDEVREWEMTLKYSCAEGAFMITNGWEKFVQDNMLQGGNTIQFFKPNKRRHNNHYNIRCIRGEEFGSAATCHQGEGYLFQHPLTLDDVSSNRLIIPTEYATSYFFGFESMDEHVSGEGQHPTTETESSNKINVSGDDSRSRHLRETQEFSTESESSVNMNTSQDLKIGSQTENSGFATEMEEEEEEEEEEEPGNSPSETEDENWPIQKRLTPTDVEEYLFLPFRSLSAYPEYFPRLSEPKDLLIIDSRNQFWSMKVVFDQERDGYVVTGMWKEFVNKHKLKATQKIKLNIPYFGLGSESSTYFNIVCMRKEGDSVTDLSSMGSEENERNSDDQCDDLDGNSDEQGDDEEGNSGEQGDDEEGNSGEQGDDEGDSDDDDGGSSQGSIN